MGIRVDIEGACACGGDTGPGSANQVVAKPLKAGANLEQVGMDEPLWFGHFYRGKNACQSSIPELASRVAVIVKIYSPSSRKLCPTTTLGKAAVSPASLDWQP